MRQRFGIAQALIGNPRLIIVDEPTAGLDPEERNRFLNLLAEILGGGAALLDGVQDDLRIDAFFLTQCLDGLKNRFQSALVAAINIIGK